MLRHANMLAKGTSGVRPEIAERIVRALNEDERPRVRMLGSIGQGDLAPMADLAAELFEDTELLAKEGIALINSNAFSTALASLAIADAERLVDTLDVTGAMDLEAFAANLTMLHPAIGDVRPYPGLCFALERTPRPPRRELPLGAGRGAKPPGPAHLPLPAADPRRHARRARVRRRASWRSSSTPRRRTR